jgi:small-conductance mechanosensitive channel
MTKNTNRKSASSKLASKNGRYEELLQIIALQGQRFEQQGQRIEKLAERIDNQEKLMNQVITTLNQHTEILNQILQGQHKIEEKVIPGFRSFEKEEK